VRLGGLLGRRSQRDDPLARRLADVPVPLDQIGRLADGLEVSEKLSGLSQVTTRGDRELGGLFEYELRAVFPNERFADLVATTEGDPPPTIAWVVESVILLVDAEAAARWFATKVQRLADYEGRVVEGILYTDVSVEPLTGIGDQVAVIVARTDPGEDMLFVDTYVVFRTGRILGGVAASTFKELDVRGDLLDLARRLLARIDAVQA
jgi:hypothetical protein